MTYSNFTNGALVMRVWRFDGDTELLAKFQYRGDAEAFCGLLLQRDEERGANKDQSHFYLAVCENECFARAFGTQKPEATS